MLKDIKTQLQRSALLKPDDLIMDELQWRYLVRSVLRGKNVMIIGPTRCGKTKAAKSVAKALNRADKFFVFNLGSTQDARSSLIGKTTFKKDTGTIFSQSEFVRAIQTKDAIILLDELSRGHLDAWNILMPVLDTTQRYLRLDESEDTALVHVAPGVTFLATANIGNEYTATKVMDKALTARFPTTIEMKVLTGNQELELLKIIFKDDATPKDIKVFEKITQVSDSIKAKVKMDNAPISTFIPTGTVIEMAELVLDGFSLIEIAEMCIYPVYSDDGGADSERLVIKQTIQKTVDTSSAGSASPVTGI